MDLSKSGSDHDEKTRSRQPIKSSSTSTTERNPSSSTVTVEIVTHPEPIKVAYATVDKLIPTLDGVDDEDEKLDVQEERHIFPKGKVEEAKCEDAKHKARAKEYDLIIHIGMAGPDSGYQLEERARGSGYVRRDVDGCLPDRCSSSLFSSMRTTGRGRSNQQTLNTREEKPKDADEGNKPDVLSPEKIDWAKVLQAWRAYVSDSLDAERARLLCLSTDAGLFLCEYIYYSSLLYFYIRRRRETMSLEEEDESDDQEIKKVNEDMTPHDLSVSTNAVKSRIIRNGNGIDPIKNVFLKLLDTWIWGRGSEEAHFHQTNDNPSTQKPPTKGESTREEGKHKDTQVIFLHVPALVCDLVQGPASSPDKKMKDKETLLGLGKDGETYVRESRAEGRASVGGAELGRAVDASSDGDAGSVVELQSGSQGQSHGQAWADGQVQSHAQVRSDGQVRGTSQPWRNSQVQSHGDTTRGMNSIPGSNLEEQLQETKEVVVGLIKAVVRSSSQ